MVQPKTLDSYQELDSSVCGINTVDIEEALPEPLRRLLSLHDNPGEYITALMTTVVIGGSIIPQVSTTYDRRRTFPMLMLFVVCPPAGGKGVVGLGSKLLEPINRHLNDMYKAALVSYQRSSDSYKASLKHGSLLTLPVKPKRLQLLVPGNITSPKLIQQLADNGALASALVETEADVVAGAFRGEHGQLNSALLRQAFHHERISSSRKTNDEVIEVETPKLAIVLAGTDNQVRSIFSGNQDGLFSRFLFLRNATSMEWRSVKPNAAKKPLDDHYQEWSDWLFRVWQQTKDFQAEVSFSDHQWDLLDERGQSHQALAHLIGGEYSVSIARRHALMVIRMATTLSFFRRADPDTGDVDTSVSSWKCDDKDFDLAMTLAELSFKNSIDLFMDMPQRPEAQFIHAKRVKFFSTLPTLFTTKDATAIATTCNISDRTTRRYLQEFCDTGMLEHISRGEYKKTTVAEVARVAAEQTDYSPGLSHRVR